MTMQDIVSRKAEFIGMELIVTSTESGKPAWRGTISDISLWGNCIELKWTSKGRVEEAVIPAEEMRDLSPVGSGFCIRTKIYSYRCE